MAEPPRLPSAVVRWPSLALVLGALLAAFVGFGRLLPAYFVGDDFAFVGRYATFPFSEWPGLFARTWQAGLFTVDLREIRPLNALAFMLDARLWGAEPFGFRLTNLLLHAASTALVGALAWEISRARRTAALAALLFAFHPATVPAVGWITGRVDVLATFFLLVAALAWQRARRENSGARPLLALGLGFAAALFTKESALVFPALALLLDAAGGDVAGRGRETRTWRPYFVLAGVLALYAACRYAAFGVAGPTGVGLGLPDVTRGTFFAELARRQASYLAHLLPPAADWLVAWRDAGRPLGGAAFWRVAALAFVGAAALVAGGRWFARDASAVARRRALCLGAGWYLAATLPLVTTYFSVRHLYPALAGLAIAAALVAHELLPTARRFAFVAAGVVVALAGWQQRALRPWLDAAERSRAFAQAVPAAVRAVEPGAFVFIDAPDLVAGAWCWSWAVPHALHPPFAAAPLEARVVPLARPAADAFRETWRQRLPLDALAQTRRDACLVRARSDGVVVAEPVPAGQVRRAARVFASAANDDDAWRDFVAALRAQPEAR